MVRLITTVLMTFGLLNLNDLMDKLAESLGTKNLVATPIDNENILVSKRPKGQLMPTLNNPETPISGTPDGNQIPAAVQTVPTQTITNTKLFNRIMQPTATYTPVTVLSATSIPTNMSPPLVTEKATHTNHPTEGIKRYKVNPIASTGNGIKTAADSSEGGSKLNTGDVIGITSAITGMVAFIVLFLVCRRKKTKRLHTGSYSSPSYAGDDNNDTFSLVEQNNKTAAQKDEIRKAISEVNVKDFKFVSYNMEQKNHTSLPHKGVGLSGEPVLSEAEVYSTYLGSEHQWEALDSGEYDSVLNEDFIRESLDGAKSNGSIDGLLEPKTASKNTNSVINPSVISKKEESMNEKKHSTLASTKSVAFSHFTNLGENGVHYFKHGNDSKDRHQSIENKSTYSQQHSNPGSLIPDDKSIVGSLIDDESVDSIVDEGRMLSSSSGSKASNDTGKRNTILKEEIQGIINSNERDSFCGSRNSNSDIPNYADEIDNSIPTVKIHSNDTERVKESDDDYLSLNNSVIEASENEERKSISRLSTTVTKFESLNRKESMKSSNVSVMHSKNAKQSIFWENIFKLSSHVSMTSSNCTPEKKQGNSFGIKEAPSVLKNSNEKALTYEKFSKPGGSNVSVYF